MKPLCPICHKPLKPPLAGKHEKSEFFPFCSQRCRLIDLGAWLDAEYRVISKSPDTSSENTDNNNEQ